MLRKDGVEVMSMSVSMQRNATTRCPFLFFFPASCARLLPTGLSLLSYRHPTASPFSSLALTPVCLLVLHVLPSSSQHWLLHSHRQ